MLTVALGEFTISRTQVQRGITGLKKARPVCPTTSTNDENIKAVKKLMLDSLRLTIKEVADDVSISFGSWQAIFTDALRMKRAAE